MINIEKVYKVKRTDVIIFIKEVGNNYYVQNDDAAIIRMFSDYRINAEMISIFGKRVATLWLDTNQFDYVMEKCKRWKVNTMVLSPHRPNQDKIMAEDSWEFVSYEHKNRYNYYLGRTRVSIENKKNDYKLRPDLWNTPKKGKTEYIDSRYNQESAFVTPRNIRSGTYKGKK